MTFKNHNNKVYAFQNTLAKTLKDLPETFTIDELFDRLLLLNKVEIGLSQARKVRFLQHRKPEKN